MLLTMSLPTDQNLRALRSLIERMRLTIREAARIVGMDHSTLNTWYQGTSKPRGEKGSESLANAVKILSAKEKAYRTETSDDLVRVGIRLVPVLSKVMVDEGLPAGGDIQMVEVMDWGTASERNAFLIDDDAMFPDLKPGTLVIADDRASEPNHVVLIETLDKERCVRVQRGRGSSAVFFALDSSYPDVPAPRANVVGVIVETVIPLPGEEESRHRYKHGMRVRK